MKKIVFLLSFFVSSQLCADWSIETSTLDKGDEHCPNGGTLISFSDSEKTDQENEEIPKAYVCNGEDGENGCKTLTMVQYNPNNQGCKNGIIVTSGLDCDDNGEIDSIDSDGSIEICNGKNAEKDGSTNIGVVEDALNGANGPSGDSGKASEIIITDEPAGENCETGGQKIENRFDENDNGEFETSEISVAYICNGKSTPKEIIADEKVRKTYLGKNFSL